MEKLTKDTTLGFGIDKQNPVSIGVYVATTEPNTEYKTHILDCTTDNLYDIINQLFEIKENDKLDYINEHPLVFVRHYDNDTEEITYITLKF